MAWTEAKQIAEAILDGFERHSGTRAAAKESGTGIE